MNLAADGELRTLAVTDKWLKTNSKTNDDKANSHGSYNFLPIDLGLKIGLVGAKFLKMPNMRPN
jgi:hypothetical protein